MINKTIAILANSVKHHQHCVAGKCIVTGDWIRPVSTPEGGELTHDQSTYSNPHGEYLVKPMQKIEMDLCSHIPLINQPENYLVSDKRWVQRYRIDEADLLKLLDNPNTLWGSNNRVNYSSIIQKITSIDQSLYLVKVDDLRIFENEENKRRATFSYNNIQYNLAVTDPAFDQILANGGELMNILCVSLGEEYNGFCYKLVATIFQK